VGTILEKDNVKHDQLDDNLRLIWKTDDSEHEGFIPLQWLKQNCYSEEELVKKRRGAEPKMAPKVKN